MPARVTPYDNCLAKFKSLKKEIIMLIIIITFKIIGAADAAASLLFEFGIPEKKDDKLTNNKNGKVILVSSTAKLNFTSSSINPGAIR